MYCRLSLPRPLINPFTLCQRLNLNTVRYTVFKQRIKGSTTMHYAPMSAPSQGPLLDWATEISQLLDHKSGTVYPALCDSLTWTLRSSNDHWRHFCLSETTMHLWLVFWCAVYKFIYLLTLLYTDLPLYLLNGTRDLLTASQGLDT